MMRECKGYQEEEDERRKMGEWREGKVERENDVCKRRERKKGLKKVRQKK